MIPTSERSKPWSPDPNPGRVSVKFPTWRYPGVSFFLLRERFGVLDIHPNKKEPLGVTKRVSQPHDSLYFGRLSITISHYQLLSNIIQLLSLLNHIKFFLFLLILTHVQVETTSDHPRIFLDSAHELDETYLVPRLGRNAGNANGYPPSCFAYAVLL